MQTANLRLRTFSQDAVENAIKMCFRQKRAALIAGIIELQLSPHGKVARVLFEQEGHGIHEPKSRAGMRLILFSSDSAAKNAAIDDAASCLFNARTRITYIPSCSNGCEPYFNMFRDYFRRFGCKRFLMLPADRPVTRNEEKEAFGSDAIYLSGGNTYYFLKHLKKSNLLRKVRSYARAGGLLLGVSAGSIIMTPSIGTAAIPAYDCDENAVGLKTFSSLGLVPFEFSPHAKFTRRYNAEMQRYCRKSGRLLYACGDGGGIVVDGSKTVLVGPIKSFFSGKLAGAV